MKRFAVGAVVFLCLGTLTACRRTEVTVRDAKTGLPIAGASIGVHRTSASGTAELRLSGDERVSADGYCAGRVDARGQVFLTPSFEVEHPERLLQVGYDRDVEVRLRLRCGDDRPVWTQVSGPPVEFRAEGNKLRFRTHALSELLPEGDHHLAVGFPRPVPIPRSARGDYRFVVDFRGKREVVRVLAAASQSGTFQVPSGTRVWLHSGVEGAFRMTSVPTDSRAQLVDHDGGFASLTPDEFGAYMVSHEASSVELLVQGGTYAEVPHDCGRPGCHVAENDAWHQTPHSTTFLRGVDGALGPDFGPRCYSCHATSFEEGINNGGLRHVAETHGFVQGTPRAGASENLPRRVRDLGSVWCSACHGPGRVLPPPQRWQGAANFGAGVCARCHDARADDPDSPHQSLQFGEWSRAKLAHFTRDLRENDPALRDECTGCHSAQGYVARVSGLAVVAPPRGLAEPITCAACHDPHGSSLPFGLRVAANSEGPPGNSIICGSCHDGEINDASDASPHAPQWLLLSGRGARLTSDGAASTHASLTDSCVHCHMRGDESGRVAGHTFDTHVDDTWNGAACAPCHEEREAVATRVQNDVRQRLSAIQTVLTPLLERIADDCGHQASTVVDYDGRTHLVDGDGTLLGDCNEDGTLAGGERGRTTQVLPSEMRNAVHDFELIRRDGSFGVHNAEYTRAVLDEILAKIQP